MVDFGALGSTAVSWLKSGMFWIIGIIIVMFIVGGFYLMMRRRGKLKYNVLEIVAFGNGKLGINRFKAGLFGIKTTLFGLFDYGAESVTKTNDGRIIQKAKTYHLHDLFGKKGYVVVRKPDDNKILVPVSKVYLKNLALLLEIAPSNYRDASVDIIKATENETKGTWEKILPYVAIGLIVVLTIISIVINQQMTNNTVEKVGNLLISGCENAQNTAPGTSP